MSAKLRDQAAEVLLDAAHVYCLDAFLRSELEGLDRTLRNLDSIEQSYAGYIRKDFLEPLIGATSGDSPRSRSWKKNRPPPKGVAGKKSEFPTEFWWRRGELKTRTRELPVRKSSIFKRFFVPTYPATYRDLPLVVPRGRSPYVPKGQLSFKPDRLKAMRAAKAKLFASCIASARNAQSPRVLTRITVRGQASCSNTDLACLRFSVSKPSLNQL